MNQLRYHGVDPHRLAAMIAAGADDHGAPLQPFTDADGGWPLRCCLRDSEEGERISIIGYSPFAWVGPYREVGPVVVHVDVCTGHDGLSFPTQFEQRDQVMRVFGDADGRTNTQVYDLNRLVRAGDGLKNAIERALSDPRAREVHVHNVISQCFNFVAMLGSERASGGPERQVHHVQPD